MGWSPVLRALDKYQTISELQDRGENPTGKRKYFRVIPTPPWPAGLGQPLHFCGPVSLLAKRNNWTTESLKSPVLLGL